MIITSILDGFYEEVKNKVLEAVPEIKHFDLYRDQYDNPLLDDKGNPLDDPFNRPALFFEWPDLNPQPLSMRRKFVNCEFALHLVQDVIQEVTARTPAAIRAKGHAHTGLINKVYTALESFNGEQAVDFKLFGAISWVGLKPYIYNGEQTTHILVFRTRIIIDEATKFYTPLSELTPPITASDEITGEIDEL